MPEKRILLIEDEATTREILTDLLRGAGYAVDSVATAGAATPASMRLPTSWSYPIGCCRTVTAPKSPTPRRSLVQRRSLSRVTRPICRREWLTAMNYNRSS